MSNVPERRAAPLLGALAFNRNFLLLLGAYFIASTSDNFNDLAQLSLVDAMEGEQFTRLMALMMFGLFLPYVVLGPLAGWCADRFSRKWTMITADVLRAILVISFGVLIPILRDAGGGVYTVMLTQMSLGVVAAFFSPARQALLPSLVRKDQLVRANALISGLAPIGAMVGFLIGGHIVEYGGARWNFRINCVTYLVSAGMVLLILAPRQAAEQKQESVFGPLAEGFRYVRGHRRIAQLIALGALFWGAAGVVYSCVPAIVKQLVSESYADVGNYRALPAIGMVIGAVGMTVAGDKLGIKRAVLIALAIAGLSLGMLAATYGFELDGLTAAITLIIIGVAGSMLLVTIMASLQRFVPDSRRGRVFGLSDMATMGAMVLATGALGLTPIPNMDDYVGYILAATAAAFFVALGVATWFYTRGPVGFGRAT